MDKPIIWMARTLKELRSMPEDVKDAFGFAADIDRIVERLKRVREHFENTKVHEDEDE